MLELIIKEESYGKRIALIENGKLIEKYDEKNENNRNEENIYLGIVKDIIPGMQSAFVDIGTEKNSFIHLKDILPKMDEKQEKRDEDVDIRSVIKRNDKILVQVKKDSNNKKGARVSTHISIPSKYIVFMPNAKFITISQKITDEEERKRLLDIVKKSLPENSGAIIRTSAINKTDEQLQEDIQVVIKAWNAITEKYNKINDNNPHLIHKSADIVEKILIDLTDKKIDKIILDDKEEYEKLKEKNIQNLVLKTDENIFDVYELEKQIEKTENRKVWLNCGGFITIDKTEALTAIDVNTGKFTGKNDLEDTIYKVNKEATIEIAKQLRLRDIGGIIIIDYIDMRNQKNKEQIKGLLKEQLKNDRAKTQVEGFTKLNLMELTRKHICSNEE